MSSDRAGAGAANPRRSRASGDFAWRFLGAHRLTGCAALATCVTTFAPIALSANVGYAAEPEGADGFPLLKPRRYEFAGFPILGGSTDIGVQFGAVGTLTRFYDDALPYLWNVDLLLSASLKDDQSGFHLVQQSHVLRLDAPELFGGRARLDARATYTRTINAGYYGIGNASTVKPLAGQTSLGRRYQYLQQEGWLRAIVRLRTGTIVDVAVAGNLRYEAPAAYDDSKLAEDLNARSGPPAAIGGPSTLLGSFTAGGMIDTRDSEFVTTRGIFYQLGVAATVGSAQDVAYGEVSAVLAHYAPLGGPFIFASRFFASFRFGRVPFYDLQQGGAFEPESLLGGDQGVRGVPMGRYAGLVKAVTNVEIRSMPFPRFHILGQRFRVGTTTFFDAGRVWSDYGAISSSDGTSLGLKFGVGGGLFAQWGEAAIFRVEAAYSPDAVSENPGFPLGIYVSDGLMF
jgi:hypothetical protein